MWVCVWTICTDVKLPSVCFVLLLLVQQDFLAIYAGGGSRVQSLPPTKTLWFPWWYMAWSAMRTCQFFQKWEEAQPKNLHVVYLNFLFTALLSQSGITFDQVWMVQLHQNLLQSKDVESILRTEVLVESTNFSCQTLMGCLCTCDAFHISNSIRCFWASVSLIPLSDKVVWALRGKPF